MARINVIALSAMALLFLTSPDGQGVPQEASVTKSITYIRQVDFRNFTYRLEWKKEKEVIQLRGGGRIRADGAQNGFQRITYGDLTGDGAEEASAKKVEGKLGPAKFRLAENNLGYP